MNRIQKILTKIGLGGILTSVILIFLGLFIIGPFFLILGLDLLGMNVNFGWKSFIGAALVILAIRPSSYNKSTK